MMAMELVDWDNKTVKIAEKAAKEADQVVMIKTINVSPPSKQFVAGEIESALAFWEEAQLRERANTQNLGWYQLLIPYPWP